MKRASDKPADGTSKPSASRPGRLTPSEIESLRKEFQEDGAAMDAELDRLEQEEKANLAKSPKQQPKNSKTGKPTTPFSYDKNPQAKPAFLDCPPEPDSLFWPDDVNDVPKPSER